MLSVKNPGGENSMGIKRLIEIDPQRCFKAIRRGRLFLLFMTVLGLVLGSIAAITLVDDKNRYDAKASVYSMVYGSYEESAEGATVLRAYSDVIKSYRVAERAALLLGDDETTKEEIYEMISVEPLIVTGTTYAYEENSSVLNIHAVDTNQNKAMRVVNAVVDAFVMEVNGVSEISATQVLDYAYDASLVYNALEMQILVAAAGVFGGLLLAVLIILYRVIFSSRIVSANDASLYGTVRLIGAIPKF